MSESEDIFGLLIASDELLLEELFNNVQDHLIKEQTHWIRQNFITNKDRGEWDQEESKVLKKTLKPFIPLIRFAEISPADFFDKVRPYKAAISNNKYEKIVEFYYKKILSKEPTLPSRVRKLASAIIKPNIATIISNWIDKNDSNVLSYNNKYRFNLIYSNSQDELDSKKFHIKCNGQGPFVVLIKGPSKKIFGGYNPIGYALRESQWLLSSDSFIFSFENDQDTHHMKIGRVIKTRRSVYENRNTSLFNFGNDFYMKGQTLYIRKRGNYNNLCDNDDLHIDETEVFSVVKM
ncbi:20709_t:CDS:2 [Funneliformis geosporum]|nr:20709_t:CDS:2 [Funneliformis geosporum]